MRNKAKCKQCGDPVQLIASTSPHDNAIAAILGQKSREYACIRGHRRFTLELDEAEVLRLRQLAYRANQADAWASPASPNSPAAKRVYDGKTRQQQANLPEVLRLHAEGVPNGQIAARLGVSRKTVYRWLQAGAQEAA